MDGQATTTVGQEFEPGDSTGRGSADPSISQARGFARRAKRRGASGVVKEPRGHRPRGSFDILLHFQTCGLLEGGCTPSRATTPLRAPSNNAYLYTPRRYPPPKPGDSAGRVSAEPPIS